MLNRLLSRASLATSLVAALVAARSAPARAESSAPAVAAGYSHACGVKADQTLWCWGANDSGQLGDGTTTSRPLPVQVTALENVVEVSVGNLYTCARKTDLTLWCWGNNASGQLGNGSAADSSTPAQVSTLGANVAEVSAGDLFACARKTDGSVWCWGSGPLGDGTSTPALAPVQVTSLGNSVAQISTGDGAACARKTDGTLWCWGFNSFGIIGNGTTNDQLLPVQVTGLGTSAADVSVGDLFACAVKSDGSVWCWGTNDKGELGDGTTTSHFAPAAVSGLAAAATQVTANGRHACARLTSGALSCWGWNGAGQIGDGTTVDRHAPVAVTALGSALQVSAGVNQNSCAGLTDGSVWCWGSDAFGQVGDGAGLTRTTPVRALVAIPANVPATPGWARAGLALLLVLVAWLGRRRWSSTALAATALALGVVSLAGCADQRAPAATDSATTAAASIQAVAGSIQIALAVPPSVQISTVTYQITRGTFTQSGSIDVSQSSTITGIIGGLPIGTGYQLALSMTDPTHALTGCSGTASFDVNGGTVTNVPIEVTCHVTPPPPPPPPPSVPVPFAAVVLLAGALLGAGLRGSGRSRRSGVR